MSENVFQCTEKTLVLLEGFTSHAGTPVGVVELSREVGLAKSTTHRILKVLERFELVEPWNGKYALSSRLAVLGDFACARKPASLRTHLQPWLQDLHTATNLIARASVLYGSDVVCIATSHDHRSLDMALGLDDRARSDTTAAGRVLLAYSSTRLQDRIARTVHKTPGIVATGSVDFHYELARIRSHGWAWSREGIQRELLSVGSAVVDEDGRAVAALTVTTRWESHTPEGLAPAVVSVAAAASKAGYADQREAIQSVSGGSPRRARAPGRTTGHLTPHGRSSAPGTGPRT
ncbi:IclR family transcriptional regulator [Nocardia tenerifensis]|uniref:IclR family transcriptional regulator n=1 Tax=Nocardia tenerifensis TaxID=228006 RepID=A0A318K7B7_9NOCA|nr:IclR family transcriptional regulator C-terminal domain-containing protein [Nocardia tenerifensis]PXX69238.1 IclR family transcriptional regulator [Nocardia tenerifensis]